MDALTFEKAFPLFNLGKFTSFLLFNKNGRTLMPIRPSYFSLTHMEMNLAEICIWFDQLQPRYTKLINTRSTKNYFIPHETQLVNNLVWIAHVTFYHNFYPIKNLSKI